MNYTDELENYDVGEIAKIDHGLYEEVFSIYKKYDRHALAMNVLVEYVVSLRINRGLDYVVKIIKLEVWS